MVVRPATFVGAARTLYAFVALFLKAGGALALRALGLPVAIAPTWTAEVAADIKRSTKGMRSRSRRHGCSRRKTEENRSHRIPSKNINDCEPVIQLNIKLRHHH
jgi:hypothetical protein